jgi:hypothetical protein
MAEGQRWEPYTQRQGQLLPAFVEDALTRVIRSFNLRRLCALAVACG